MAYYGMEAMVTTGVMITNIVVSIIMIFLGAWLLQLTSKWTSLKDNTYKTALGIALILGLIGIVWNVILILAPMFVMLGLIVVIAQIALGLWLIKTRYKVDWGKAVIVGIIWLVLEIVVSMIIGFVVAAIGLAAIFGGAM